MPNKITKKKHKKKAAYNILSIPGDKLDEYYKNKYVGNIAEQVPIEDYDLIITQTSSGEGIYHRITYNLIKNTIIFFEDTMFITCYDASSAPISTFSADISKFCKIVRGAFFTTDINTEVAEELEELEVSYADLLGERSLCEQKIAKDCDTIEDLNKKLKETEAVEKSEKTDKLSTEDLVGLLGMVKMEGVLELRKEGLI